MVGKPRMADLELTSSAVDPNFYEARAIVLSKMGNHKQALEIYVFKLHDPAKAEEWVLHCPAWRWQHPLTRLRSGTAITCT